MSILPEPTALAKKYGVWPKDRDPEGLFWPFSKSGFTPSEAPSILTSLAQVNRAKDIDQYQEDFLLCGSNARGLEYLGAMPDPNMKDTSLSNPIHPVFHLNNWDNSTNLPPTRILLPFVLRGDVYQTKSKAFNTGFWTASNPIVWEALAPVLRIVSRFIAEIHTSLWIDAHLCGKYEEISDKDDPRPEQEKRHGRLWKFHRRDPVDAAEKKIYEAEALAGTSTLLQVLGERITFGISSHTIEPTTNQGPGKGNSYHGVTMSKRNEDAVYLVLTKETLMPLFRNDLNTSEMLTEQFFVAQVLIHELGHALYMALDGTQPWYNKSQEPYFENEIYAELGFSFESSLFGGPTVSFVQHEDLELPHLGFFVETFPSFVFNFPPHIGGDSAIPNEFTLTPISADYYSMLQSDGFWRDGVRRWGLPAMKPHQSLGYSTTITKDKDGSRLTAQNLNPTDPFWKIEGELLANHQDLMEKLVKLDAAEKDVYRLAELFRQKQVSRREQVRFKDMRSNLAETIVRSLSEIETAWDATNLSLVTVELRKLLDVLEEEVHHYVDEIIKLTKDVGSTDPDHLKHGKYVARLNRHLRELTTKVIQDSIAINSQEIQIRAERIGKALNACLTLVRVINNEPGVIMPADPKAFVLESFNGANDTAVTALEATNDPVDKMNQAMEETRILKHAEMVFSTRDQARCKKIGSELISTLGTSGLARGVAFVLFACLDASLRRDYYASRALSILGGCKDDANTTEEMRVYTFWMEAAVEIEEEIDDDAVNSLGDPSNCAKRGKETWL